MKIKTIVTSVAISTSVILSSCTKGDGPIDVPGGSKVAYVKTTPVSFAGGSSLDLEGENEIKDMQACLFQGGIMTQVYEDLTSTDAGYGLQVDRLEGRLYMLANLSEKIDLNTMLISSTSEEDFFKTAIDMGSDGKTVNFFTGVVELSGPDTYSYTAGMERGVARFDLAVTSGSQPVKVKKIEVTNVALKGYLRTLSEGVSTPEAAGSSSVTVEFDEPVTEASKGFLYLYEQKNSGMQVIVTVEAAGQEKTLTKSISGDISRNTVYAIKVNKSNIDLYINANIEEWESGADTEIEA